MFLRNHIAPLRLVWAMRSSSEKTGGVNRSGAASVLQSFRMRVNDTEEYTATPIHKLPLRISSILALKER